MISQRFRIHADTKRMFTLHNRTNLQLSRVAYQWGVTRPRSNSSAAEPSPAPAKKRSEQGLSSVQLWDKIYGRTQSYLEY